MIHLRSDASCPSNAKNYNTRWQSHSQQLEHQLMVKQKHVLRCNCQTWAVTKMVWQLSKLLCCLHTKTTKHTGMVRYWQLMVNNLTRASTKLQISCHICVSGNSLPEMYWYEKIETDSLVSKGPGTKNRRHDVVTFSNIWPPSPGHDFVLADYYEWFLLGTGLSLLLLAWMRKAKNKGEDLNF